MQTGPCRYKGKDIRVASVSVECVKSFMKSEWYRVGQFVFRLWVIYNLGWKAFLFSGPCAAGQESILMKRRMRKHDESQKVYKTVFYAARSYL